MKDKYKVAVIKRPVDLAKKHTTKHTMISVNS